MADRLMPGPEYRTYAGERFDPGNVQVTVDGRKLEHRVRHSPDGFEWGYGGSGPADLARSILWDFLGAEPHPRLYQQFKADHVVKWGERWMITSLAIRFWLADLPLGMPRLWDPLRGESGEPSLEEPKEPTPPREIHVVFDGPPSHESGRFVEVEDADGHSIGPGRWEQRGNFWHLIFTADDFAGERRPCESSSYKRKT